MHFSKTYAEILASLPPDMRENAIEYRQLKKLINQIVSELTALGLSPAVLHDLFRDASFEESDQVTKTPTTSKGKERAPGERPGEVQSIKTIGRVTGSPLKLPGSDGEFVCAKAAYELVDDGENVQPRLRIWIETPTSDADSPTQQTFPANVPLTPSVEEAAQGSDLNLPQSSERIQDPDVVESTSGEKTPKIQPRRASQASDRRSRSRSSSNSRRAGRKATFHAGGPKGFSKVVARRRSQAMLKSGEMREVIIPLLSDSAFFQLFNHTLTALAAHLKVVQSNFTTSLNDLARQISSTARPQHLTSSRFRPYSSSTDPSSVTTPIIQISSKSLIPGHARESGLYTWREIFQLYVETEVFESMREQDRGERSVEEAEERLTLFVTRLTDRGLIGPKKLKGSESRQALDAFLELNSFILDLKKFHHANSEAARKILKKHTKRTSLPLPDISSSGELVRVPSRSSGGVMQTETQRLYASLREQIPSLPHMLVQAVGEMLLPIIPHIDDYECSICSEIAFKPIRLACSHLFCVRCLVKMQKRGQGHCPICRADTVLQADRSNVDWALLNFMQDWFPKESKAKLKQNEQETSQELMEELGLNDNKCVIC